MEKQLKIEETINRIKHQKQQREIVLLGTSRASSAARSLTSENSKDITENHLIAN